MKIGEVVVGKEYGAVDEPARRYSATQPRQVKVLEVVTEAEQVYSRYTSSAATTRNVRRLKVEVLDLPTIQRASSWSRDKIKCAKQGATIVIEARNLVGEWKDLSADIIRKRDAEQAKLEASKALEDRIIALVGGKAEYSRFHLNVRGPHTDSFEAEFKGKTLQRILDLAEKGKAAS